MTKTIEELQNELIDEFEPFDDWMDRYQLIIEMGDSLPLISDAEKVDDNLIEGCQSRVWIVCSQAPDGKLYFRADSDALIVKGIVAMLLRIYDGQTPNAILQTPLFFIEKLNLTGHLSPTRSNGLMAMLARIKEYATSKLEG
ncbi:SufE family protein [Porphyromonas miyakawae]|jgi:hypothetical protein|uniref:SufE family protein n=1 Tax=Porphyromonas miyakawae TaxID=3137470 RepID=A0ABQ0E1P0_9PORP